VTYFDVTRLTTIKSDNINLSQPVAKKLHLTKVTIVSAAFPSTVAAPYHCLPHRFRDAGLPISIMGDLSVRN
jgi:hypothetical protein